VHREVAGHHASFFPPGDTQALSRLLLSVNTAQEREVVWGREFTWERNAARIARVFEETLSRGQPLP
jgi:glycosyltransferase involved in cell wall biosynthesis